MLSEQEIKEILSDLNELYQYDFNFYSKESFKRRINRLYGIEKFSSFNELKTKLRTNKNYADHFVDRITVNVTSMFRDPAFFLDLRKNILVHLAERETIRIWHAGCSTGEEAFSLAILLKETELLSKSELYASDVNPYVIEKAKQGIFPVSLMQVYEKNYLLSGGTLNFGNYYSVTGNGQKIKDELKNKIHFFTHSLANDKSPGTFDLILCRNVLIYFDFDLQEKVFKLFDDSLNEKSFLALGEKETLRLSPIASKYLQLTQEKIWQKK